MNKLERILLKLHNPVVPYLHNHVFSECCDCFVICKGTCVLKDNYQVPSLGEKYQTEKNWKCAIVDYRNYLNTDPGFQGKYKGSYKYHNYSTNHF